MDFKRRYIGIILLPVIVVNISLAQSKKNREDFLYGEYYISQGQYEKALPFYLEVQKDMRDNSNINYRIGQCYSKIPGQQYEAIPYLKVAVKEINENYIEGKFKNTGAPREAWLLLGDAFQRDNMLLEASYAYHKYKSYLKSSDKHEMELVKDKIHSVGISYELQRDSRDVNISNLGNVVNTRFSDYNPVLSGDQSTLIYTSFWESYDKIMYTTLSNGAWMTPRDITDEVGSKGDCYSAALSYDGTELYLVKMGRFNNDIYYSDYQNGKWSKMKALNNKINSKSQESSVSVSSDGKTLYFSSDRSGGEGNFDIYSATKESGDWNDIKNLGTPINTTGREEAPYISIDGITLFFCSNGHAGLGGVDIFYSNLNADNTWGEPQNMGLPYNTTEDDLFFVYFKKTKTGYVSRKLEDSFGKNDIYKLQEGAYDMPYVRDKTTHDPSTNSSTVSDEHTASETLDSPTVPGETDLVYMNDFQNNTMEQHDESQTDEAYHINSEMYNETAGDNTMYDMSTNNSPDSDKHVASGTVDLPPVPGETDLVYMNDFQNNSTEQRDENRPDEEYLASSDIVHEPVLDSYSEGVSAQYDMQGFTIQIMALYHPVAVNYFEDVQNVRMIKGIDGFHRYITGTYDTYSSARKRLKEIRNFGYHDAFIRELKSIPNIQ